MITPVIRKYLDKYAEPELSLLPDPGTLATSYDRVLIIPACDEAEDFLSQLLQHLKLQSPLLVILVLNAPATEKPAHLSAQASTRALLASLRDAERPIWQSSAAELALVSFTANPAIDLLLVDRCSPERCIPHRQGVGLARKIGNDIALALFTQNIIRVPWLYNTDADVKLPCDYFSASLVSSSIESSASAILWPYEHHPETPELELATTLYELSLHYYVKGLQAADSPYAYHTVGSTLVVNMEHYARVRGFPKRSAAEDFHLLNKLAKTGSIASAASAPILVRGRDSQRVPLGTGPALARICELNEPLQEFKFFNPMVFEILGHWLAAIPQLWSINSRYPNSQTDELVSKAIAPGNDAPPLEPLKSGLQALNLCSAIEHAAAHSQSEAAFTRHVHNWFDALKTLQLIHHLRDNGLPSLPYGESVACANFMAVQANSQNASDRLVWQLEERLRSWKG